LAAAICAAWAKFKKSRQDAGATRERRLRFLDFDVLQASTCGAGVIFVRRLPTDLRFERTAKRTQAKVADEHLQTR